MSGSGTSLKSKSENRCAVKGQGECETQSSQRISARSILNAIGSKLFSGIQTEQKTGSPEAKLEDVEEEIEIKELDKEKEEKEEKEDKEDKEDKKVKTKKVVDESWKRSDRDFVKFKTKYNSSMGNILRSWMSLIYCILFLRLNLIKFVEENLPELNGADVQLQKQLREENLAIYKMIRKAQVYSQERSLFLWMHLEKLMHSRILIKNALDVVRTKDTFKDWKGAAMKLAQVEEELDNIKRLRQTLMTNALNEEVARLEGISLAKGKQLDILISQISQLKKREVQMRGRILLNMKNYKDLNKKRKYLISIQKETNLMKNNQGLMTTEYTNKIQEIQSQIENNEKQIKHEKEEIKKLRANLDEVGDVSMNSVAVNET